MKNNENALEITVKDVAADIVYMTGGIDPDFISVNEIVTDTLEEHGITDEDAVEEFTHEVYALISSAIVTVSWTGDDDAYVFNEDEED
jgi:hypothetical protein